MNRKIGNPDRYRKTFSDAYFLSVRPYANPYLSSKETHTTISVPPIDARLEQRFVDRLSELKKLGADWEGYGAIPPFPSIVSDVAAFLSEIPKSFRAELDEEDIIPNPNGTVTVEWRTSEGVLSIEFGILYANYLFRMKGEFVDEGEKINVTTLSQRLGGVLRTMLK